MTNDLTTKRGSLQLWQFLLKLLQTPNNEHIIEWTRKSCAEFKLLDPEEVARLWGISKNRPTMNYDKLSRSLRYYYEKGIMQKVAGERYVYRFINHSELYELLPELAQLKKQQQQILHGQENALSLPHIKIKSESSRLKPTIKSTTPKIKSMSHRFNPYGVHPKPQSVSALPQASITINNLNYEINNCSNYILNATASNTTPSSNNSYESGSYQSSYYSQYASSAKSNENVSAYNSINSSHVSTESPKHVTQPALSKTSTPNAYPTGNYYNYYADYYANNHDQQGLTSESNYSSNGYTYDGHNEASFRNADYPFHKASLNAYYSQYSGYESRSTQNESDSSYTGYQTDTSRGGNESYIYNHNAYNLHNHHSSGLNSGVGKLASSSPLSISPSSTNSSSFSNSSLSANSSSTLSFLNNQNGLKQSIGNYY